MKKYTIILFLSFLTAFACMNSAKAIDCQDIEDNHLNYFDSYKDTDKIKLNDFYCFLFELNNIDKSLVDQFLFKAEYRCNSYGYNANTSRMTAIINLMRAYMIIPDVNSIEYYPWTDIPESDMMYSITNTELAYISYARKLGITKGISETEFGFNKDVTIGQLKIFINNIKKLSMYQVDFPFEYESSPNIKNLDKLVLPLIIEYMNSLPEKVKNKIINSKWKFYFCENYVPGYNEGTIGLTDCENRIITLSTLRRPGYLRIFTETMVHEFGHVIYHLSNIKLIDDEIINIEKPKLSTEYKSYANKNKNEFIACAWTYLYYVGDDYFSIEYPYTYEFIQDMISRIE